MTRQSRQHKKTSSTPPAVNYPTASYQVFDTISGLPTANIAVSGLPTAYVAFSGLPTAFIAISGLPTACIAISGLPTAFIAISGLPTAFIAIRSSHLHRHGRKHLQPRRTWRSLGGRRPPCRGGGPFGESPWRAVLAMGPRTSWSTGAPWTTNATRRILQTGKCGVTRSPSAVRSFPAT